MSQVRRSRVLVAEDEPFLLRSYVRALQGEGYEVIGVDNGIDGLSTLEHAEFDVVVSDVLMPGLGGIDILRMMYSHDPDVPVVLLTGSPSLDLATLAIEYGVHRFLSKPVAIPDLLRAVRRAADLRAVSSQRKESVQREAREHEEKRRLSDALDATIAGLYLVAQPIVQLEDKSIYGFEVLMRSTVSAFPHPGAILEAADRVGRLVELGRAVRRAATKIVPMLPPKARLFVNLHPMDLSDDDILSPLAPLTAHASRVVLEITERAALEAVPHADSRLRALRHKGFEIAIDDLGAGYAGLTSFATLSPEVAKIDMSLIRGIDAAPMKQKIIRSIASLCHDLGIAVVAEGVETRSERDVLASMGIRLLQGYLFGRPSKDISTQLTGLA